MKVPSITRSGSSAAEAKPASRPVRTRPQLRDPRLAIGILLVAAAVALGIYLMKAVDSRVGVWAAASTLTPGTSLAGNVVKVEVHEDVAGIYLSADAEPSGSVTRTVGTGELIARSATSRDEGERATRSIVLPLGTELPKSAVRGASVDVWFIPRAVPGSAGGTPLIIAPGAIIEQVHEAATLGVRAHGSIEVSVSADHVPAVLSALAEQGLIAVVPQSGTL